MNKLIQLIQEAFKVTGINPESWSDLADTLTIEFTHGIKTQSVYVHVERRFYSITAQVMN